MNTTGTLSIVRSIDGTELENWTTDFVSMESGAFSASQKGRDPSVSIIYNEALKDGFHSLDLDPDTWRRLEYRSEDGKLFRATGTVRVTVSGFQSQQKGEIDATLTDAEGRVFQLTGNYEGKNPL